MRLATRAAILMTLLAATGVQAETTKIKPKKSAETAIQNRAKSLQVDALQDVVIHRSPLGASSSLTPQRPNFGFDSSFGWQHNALGQRVTDVQFGGLASRLDLKLGDMIVGVNGQELRTADGWQNAIERAADQDGWVTLKVLDGRSGRMAYRTANLFQTSEP